MSNEIEFKVEHPDYHHDNSTMSILKNGQCVSIRIELKSKTTIPDNKLECALRDMLDAIAKNRLIEKISVEIGDENTDKK